MPIPFLVPLLMAAGGAGLGALKGATDGKKGNLLSSMLIGGGLGAAGGLAGPALMGALGAGGAGAAGAAGAAKAAGAAGAAASGTTAATGAGAAASGAGTAAGAAGGAAKSGGFLSKLMSDPSMQKKMLGIAGDQMSFLGQPSSQQYPEYGAMPYTMPVTFQSGPITPASGTLMPYGGGY